MIKLTFSKVASISKLTTSLVTSDVPLALCLDLSARTTRSSVISITYYYFFISIAVSLSCVVINPFIHNAPFLNPLKTSENRNVFREQRKGALGRTELKQRLFRMNSLLPDICMVSINRATNRISEIRDQSKIFHNKVKQFDKNDLMHSQTKCG